LPPDDPAPPPLEWPAPPPPEPPDDVVWPGISWLPVTVGGESEYWMPLESA